MIEGMSICGKIPMARLGSEEGGYWIPAFEDFYEIVYDIGVGEDVSFASELLYICDGLSELHLFDPTDRSANYFEHTWEEGIWDSNSLAEIRLHSFAISDKDTGGLFYPPKNPLCVSYSEINIQQTERPVWFPRHRLSTVMRILGHTHLSLLKIDAEGSEYAILYDLLDLRELPSVVVVEYHTPYGEGEDEPYRTVAQTHEYMTRDFVLLRREGRNYTYMRKDYYDRHLASDPK